MKGQLGLKSKWSFLKTSKLHIYKTILTRINKTIEGLHTHGTKKRATPNETNYRYLLTS